MIARLGGGRASGSGNDQHDNDVRGGGRHRRRGGSRQPAIKDVHPKGEQPPKHLQIADAPTQVRDRSRSQRRKGGGKGNSKKGKDELPAMIECGGGNSVGTPTWLRNHYRNSISGKYICFPYKRGKCPEKNDHGDVIHACNHDQCRDAHSIQDCPRRTR